MTIRANWRRFYDQSGYEIKSRTQSLLVFLRFYVCMAFFRPGCMFPGLSIDFLFTRTWHQLTLHVSPAQYWLAVFPTFGTGCIFSPAQYWLPIFPALGTGCKLPALRPDQVVCFHALLIAWFWWQVFSHLPPASWFCSLVQRRKNENETDFIPVYRPGKLFCWAHLDTAREWNSNWKQISGK